MGVPLAEQIEEVEKEIRNRVRLYEKWVASGRYHAETAERKLAAMRAVQSTLMWLSKNENWIKAVGAVKQKYPDAEVNVVRDVRQKETA